VIHLSNCNADKSIQLKSSQEQHHYIQNKKQKDLISTIIINVPLQTIPSDSFLRQTIPVLAYRSICMYVNENPLKAPMPLRAAPLR
jgi:hypothetical protein